MVIYVPILYFRPVVYRSLELSQSSTTRALSYVVPSLVFSIILNVPKFLEAKLITTQVEDDNITAEEVTDYDATELRVDPDYIYYYIHWTRYSLVHIGLSSIKDCSIGCPKKVKSAQILNPEV